MRQQVIYLRQAAPAKPAVGAPCNGCGVCCAVATCPVARLFLGQWRGPCRALEWHEAQGRYLCGMLARPGSYLRALPRFAAPWFARRVRRWIGGGIGCDCTMLA